MANNKQKVRMQLLGVLLVLISIMVFSGPATAEDLTPPAGPDNPLSARYKLVDLYNRVLNGDNATLRNGAFQGPSSGPTSFSGPTLDAIMAEAPTKDNVNGASPADVAAGKKFWGLRTDGTWGPKSGQVFTCSPSGTPNGTRWCDNGDGTVTDLISGLIWLQDASCMRISNWSTAISNTISNLKGDNSICTPLLNDGSVWGDWRLPTKPELENLANGTEAVSSTSQRAFFGVQSMDFWSSTTTASNQNYAWALSYYGYAYQGVKTNSYYVWPVRGGQ